MVWAAFSRAVEKERISVALAGTRAKGRAPIEGGDTSPDQERDVRSTSADRQVITPNLLVQEPEKNSNHKSKK